MDYKDRLAILLVEDNELNQKLMKISLTRYNYMVTIAVNGYEGVQCFKKQKFDLILMDIMMPVMDGYDAMRLIRSQKKYQSLPVIALTAKAMSNDKQKCIDAGANDYVAKPIDTERLLTLMRVWMSK